jgi:hypothetical protein
LRSSPPAHALAIALVNDEVGYQKKVDMVRAIGGIEHDDHATVFAPGHRFGMGDAHPPSISEVDFEWPERMSFVKFFDSFDGHADIL